MSLYVMNVASIEKIKKQTVRIDVSVNGENGNGTGLIIDKNGTILTCEHVVYPQNQKPDTINVTTDDGTSYETEIICRDVSHDLALLKTKSLSSDVNFVKFDDIALGDDCYIFGYPIGLPHLSVTKGIVSAKGKFLVKDLSFNTIQLDARINQGNSGGPVYHASSGKLMGIITMKYVPFFTKVTELQKFTKTLPVLSGKGIGIGGINWNQFFNYVNESVKRTLEALMLVQVGIGWAIPSDFCIDFINSK